MVDGDSQAVAAMGKGSGSPSEIVSLHYLIRYTIFLSPYKVAIESSGI